MTTDCLRCFDSLAADSKWRRFTAGERRMVGAFVRRWRIKPGDHVLEPGCGSGRLTAVLAALTGPGGRVVAFDSSAELMGLASRRRLPAHVKLLTARADTLPLEPGSFDHVVCFNVFPHLVPQAAIVRRLAAALRPGGAFWIAHTCSRAFVNDIHRSGPTAIRDHLLPGRGKLMRLLRGAGLGKVKIEDGADRFLARAVRPSPKPPKTGRQP